MSVIQHFQARLGKVSIVFVSVFPKMEQQDANFYEQAVPNTSPITIIIQVKGKR